MKLAVEKSKLNGEIAVPGSKSHTIRAVAVSAMADGVSEIRSPLVSGDTISSLNAAAAFGAGIEKEKNLWKIKGVGGCLRISQDVIDLGNSGTSLRIFTALAATCGKTVGFDGDESLRTRPMSPLLFALGKLGAKTESADGRCPLSVTGPIKGGRTSVEGKSSQFVSALLFAAPLIEGDTVLEVYGLNEKPYVGITIDWLEKQGIKFSFAGDYSRFEIEGGQEYRPFSVTIPGDFSTAAFPLAAAAVTGSEIAVKNLDFNDRQGDREVFSYLEKMGMKIRRSFDRTLISPVGKLRGIEIDLNATPDALPAMAAVGCFAEGATKLFNVPQARIKETDRIACMSRELRKMGADIEELPDGMVIRKSKLSGCEVESHMDHRIAMALAVAGLGIDGKTVVNGAESAEVTYPDFINDFRKLGAKIKTCQT